MKYFKKTSAFTLIEIIVVCAIIAVITAIVVPALMTSQARGRDAEVRAQVQTIKLALARAAQANANGAYPGQSNTSYCLTTTSGTCFRGGANESDTLNNTGYSPMTTGLLQFFPGKVYPQAQGAVSGQYRYNAYVYNPYDAGIKIPNYNGPVLIWWQEKIILQSDCNGTLAGALDTGVYYCYERLAQ